MAPPREKFAHLRHEQFSVYPPLTLSPRNQLYLLKRKDLSSYFGWSISLPVKEVVFM